MQHIFEVGVRVAAGGQVELAGLLRHLRRAGKGKVICLRYLQRDVEAADVLVHAGEGALHTCPERICFVLRRFCPVLVRKRVNGKVLLGNLFEKRRQQVRLLGKVGNRNLR